MKNLFPLFLTLFLLQTPTLAQEIIISTFNNDDEGWTVGGAGLMFYYSTGGNPDGFIEFEDLDAGAGAFVAPQKFLGDLSDYSVGALSFDLKNTIDNGQNILMSYGDIRILSEQDTVYKGDIVDTFYLNDWTSFVVPFTADEWGKTTEEWDSLLSNVIDIRIFIDPQPYHFDRAGMDNFSISPFPVNVRYDDKADLPDKFNLTQNYPNPYNPNTTIRYSIPQSSIVLIKVYDVLGKEMKVLVNEEKPAGTYEITWYAEGLPSGVYFYRLQAGDFIQTKKMILMK